MCSNVFKMIFALFVIVNMGCNQGGGGIFTCNIDGRRFLSINSIWTETPPHENIYSTCLLSKSSFRIVKINQFEVGTYQFEPSSDKDILFEYLIIDSQSVNPVPFGSATNGFLTINSIAGGRIKGEFEVTVTSYSGEGTALEITDGVFDLPLAEQPTSTVPIMTITQPTTDDSYDPPGTTDPDTINLSGTASDDGEIVEVTWSNNKGGSGMASGTTNWSIADITLYCGDYDIITVYAKDSEGNIGTDTLTVNVAPCPPTDLNILPEVTINQPTSESSYITVEETITLAGTASDNSAVTRVTWSNNRGNSGEAEGTIDWIASDINLFCGDHNIITITAEDDQGGTDTATLTVDVPPCPPTGLIVE